MNLGVLHIKDLHQTSFFKLPKQWNLLKVLPRGFIGTVFRISSTDSKVRTALHTYIHTFIDHFPKGACAV